MPAARKGWYEELTGKLPPMINPGPVNSAPPPARPGPLRLEGDGDYRVARGGSGRYYIQQRHHVDVSPMLASSSKLPPEARIYDTWMDVGGETGPGHGCGYLFRSSAERAIRRHQRRLARQRAHASRTPV